jgi:uncharacterized protein
MNSDPSPMIDYLIKRFNLKELPIEGGVYSRGYLSKESISKAVLPVRYKSDHPYGSGIYYLLTPDPNSFSAMHVLPTDEVYHFYLGDPVEMLQLFPDGSSKRIILGQDLEHGQEVQVVAPAGAWQGSHLFAGGSYALLGTTMAPGYINEDFTLGHRAELTAQYPSQAELIKTLTRE